MVAEDLIQLLKFITINVTRAFLMRQLAFIVNNTVGGTFGLGRLHFVHCSATLLWHFTVFHQKFTKLVSTNISGSKRRQAYTAMHKGSADRAMPFLRNKGTNFQLSFLCGNTLKKCI